MKSLARFGRWQILSVTALIILTLIFPLALGRIPAYGRTMTVPATPPTPPDPTPTVTPVPTPSSNHNPVVQTRNLPKGRVNKPYFATVLGYDQDLDDNLAMTISGLPAGLNRGLAGNMSKEIKNIFPVT